jgi:hypothetical protein
MHARGGLVEQNATNSVDHLIFFGANVPVVDSSRKEDWSKENLCICVEKIDRHRAYILGVNLSLKGDCRGAFDLKKNVIKSLVNFPLFVHEHMQTLELRATLHPRGIRSIRSGQSRWVFIHSYAIVASGAEGETKPTGPFRGLPTSNRSPMYPSYPLK